MDEDGGRVVRYTPSPILHEQRPLLTRDGLIYPARKMELIPRLSV